MKLSLVGLGKMGSQIAEVLLKDGHELLIDRRNPEKTNKYVELGAQSYQDYSDLVDKFTNPPVIWLMIPADEVPAEIDKLLKVLPEGSIIVDGGNSKFTSTIEQSTKCSSQNVLLVDVGTSGGVWGAKQGFSMMVGGKPEAVSQLKPILDTLSGSKGGWHHFGQSGAGHYVKMIHNGVEYGIMQSYAEGYRLLKEGPIGDIELDKVAEIWQKGSINESFLNGLIENMLKQDQEFSDIEGVVSESGEAKWTLQTAKELGISLPAIQTAFDTRIASQTGDINWSTKFLAQLRNEFGGHRVNPDQKEE